MRAPPSVLIVDDEAAMALALEILFETSGFRVCGTAATRDEAVDLAIASHPDFILMDIRLSGKGDGIEAADQILARIETRIIFVSGYSDADVMRRAMTLQPLAYLVKPISLAELVALVRRAWEEQSRAGSGSVESE